MSSEPAFALEPPVTAPERPEWRSRPVAISVADVSKCYQIYEKPQHRLFQGLFRNRRRFFREFWALRNVTFDIHQGQTLGIIGRNGSGKSTLLQIICGTSTATTGTVAVNGRVAALLELGAGFNPEFTGRENVYMNGTVLGLTRAQLDERFDAIAAFADIGDFIEQPVKAYSSGMFVRLAFAVAAHVDADILVIDEALAVGDAYFTQKCMRFLRAFRERGTLLFVSHDTGALANLCDTAIWLDNGAVRQIGDAKHVSEDYLQAVYEQQQGESDLAAALQQMPAMADVGAAAGQSDADANTDDGDEAGDVVEDGAAADAPSIVPEILSKKAFGIGGAIVTSVTLTDAANARVNVVSRAIEAALSITCLAQRDLFSPIIGFTLRDRLGQDVFGENTFRFYQRAPVTAKAGDVLQARFTFVLPRLPLGDYSVSVAVAEGTQFAHVQHHWVHDVLVFTSQPEHHCFGLVGLELRGVDLRVREPHRSIGAGRPSTPGRKGL